MKSEAHREKKDGNTEKNIWEIRHNVRRNWMWLELSRKRMGEAIVQKMIIAKKS